MDVNIDLPEGWTFCNLKDIGKIISGGTPSTTESSFWGNDIAWITPADLSGYTAKQISKGKKSISNEGLKNSSARMLPKGSVLFSSRAPIGYVAIASNELATNQGFKSIIPNNNIDSNYLYYYLKHNKRLAEDSASGTTFKEISGSKFSELPFIYPSIDEQHQIVEKIEELFSELDKGIENLKTAQQQLKVYRQAVLKWAFEGKLTNDDVQDGVLTEGWEQIEFGRLFSESPQNGLYKSSSEYGSGTPIVRIDGFYEGKMVYNYDFKRVKLNSEEIKRYSVRIDDILLNRVNSMPYLGKCGIVKLVAEPTVFESNIMKIRVNVNTVLPEYITLYLSSKKGLQELKKNAKHAVNQASINQTDVSNVLIPFCEKKEQIEIIQEIKSRLSVCDKMDEAITASLQQAEALRQSILKRAFEGKLVRSNINFTIE